MLKPLAEEQWDYTKAAHLLNRAGFGGPPAEIDELVAMGLQKAVSRFVDYEKTPDQTADPEWARPDLERMQKLAAARKAGAEERRKLQREEQQRQRQRIIELRAWWLQRMATGPRPLQEKMVLFWHGHFATSFEKVRDAYLMWRQNELFRRLATGNWQQLLVEVGKDPAMLLWLDQAQSRRQHPNENFAREVMELFALGEGHYSEKDISEGARALTGWSYDRATQKFMNRPYWHDNGEKTVFGRTGDFDGEDFLAMIVVHPQAAPFITGKLWRFLAGTEPSPELLGGLARVFRQAGNNFKPVLRTMFLSEEFYSPAIIRNQVKSPVQWLVGSVRMLERPLPPPLACAGLTRDLGQDLFAPPNVKGWDGGLSWISTNSLLARYNHAAMLVQGDLSSARGMVSGRALKMAPQLERRLRTMRLPGVDLEKLFSSEERHNKDALMSALQKRLLQAELKPTQQAAFREYLEARGALDEEEILNAIRLAMSTPEFQLT